MQKTVSSFFARVDERSKSTANKPLSHIEEEKFFRHLFGFDETVEKVKDCLSVTSEADGCVFLASSANKKSYQVGFFELTEVGDFEVPTGEGQQPGTFSVVAGRGYATRDYDRVDVGGVQATPANSGATFQVASNFNCLEYVSGAYNASHDGVTPYLHDRTQGPAASISAAPGTVYRNYLAPHRDRNDALHVGQLEQQINLLDYFAPRATHTQLALRADSDDDERTVELARRNSDESETTVELDAAALSSPNCKRRKLADTPPAPAAPIVPVRNGYIYLTSDARRQLPPGALAGDAWLRHVRVGAHYCTAVTTGTRRNGRLAVAPRNQYVNQVFVASIDLAGCGTTPAGREVAHFCLRSAYRGTLLAAYRASRLPRNAALPGRRRVFLTLVGGGVFCNKKEWVVDAIVECEPLIRASGLEVVLNLYDVAEISQKADWAKLQALVERTGGKIEKLQ